MQWDLRRGDPAERDEVLANIAAVPLPDADPVQGSDGPLTEIWNRVVTLAGPARGASCGASLASTADLGAATRRGSARAGHAHHAPRLIRPRVPTNLAEPAPRPVRDCRWGHIIIRLRSATAEPRGVRRLRISVSFERGGAGSGLGWCGGPPGQNWKRIRAEVRPDPRLRAPIRLVPISGRTRRAGSWPGRCRRCSWSRCCRSGRWGCA